MSDAAPPAGVPVTATPDRASVRREVRIARPAAEVWRVVGDPAGVHRWFPGMADSSVDGAVRVITTDSGLPLPEEIVTLDHLQRRFQYRVTAPMFRHHLGTIDVHDLGDECLVVYATDAEPAAMAAMVGGATGAALLELRRLLEADELAPRTDHDGQEADA